jgi:hypothetical protein
MLTCLKVMAHDPSSVTAKAYPAIQRIPETKNNKSMRRVTTFHH